jgi:protein-disulfide isomerase
VSSRRKKRPAGRPASGRPAEKPAAGPQPARPAGGSSVGRTAFIWANVLAVLVTVAVIGVSRVAASSSTGSFDVVDGDGATPTASPSPGVVPSDLPTWQELATGNSIGSPDAPVVLTEFAEFQCTICQAFYAGTEQEIREKLVETGKVRVVFKHFVMYGEESMNAALASEAAAEQGKFWEYHDLLMELRASPKEEGDLTIEKLQELAAQLGLDMDKFNASLLSGKNKDLIEKEFRQGRAMGVEGTPTYFVHGGAGEGVTRTAKGNLPYADFSELVDALIAESEGQ